MPFGGPLARTSRYRLVLVAGAAALALGVVATIGFVGLRSHQGSASVGIAPGGSARASGSGSARPLPTPPPGYPSAATTGVPKGLALRDGSADRSYTRSGSVHLYRVATPGAVVQGIDVHGSLYVTAPNVTIRDVRIHCDGGASAGAIHQAAG